MSYADHDDLGEAIRAEERARIRTKVAARRTTDESCTLMAGCEHCAYNDAIDDVLDLIDDPTPETRT